MTEATPMRKPLSFADLANLPVSLSIPQAGRIGWGMSRAMSYQLASQGDFPCAVVQIGARFHVRTADLLRALGFDPELLLTTTADAARAATAPVSGE